MPPKPAALSIKTLGGLIAEYKKSPEYSTLAPDTVISYNRAFDALADWRHERIDVLEPRHILGLRDRLFANTEPKGPRGRWIANMVVSVLSVVLAWAVPRGYAELNVAAGVPKIRRRGRGVANPSWSPAELAALLELCRGGMRKGVALAYYTGMRLKDVVETKAEARESGAIERVSSKPDTPITVFEAKRLTDILDEEPVGRVYLVENQDGQQFTRSGFNSNFQKLKAKLVKAGKLRPDRTFHGLRKSLGRDAADLGFDEKAIAGALGQTSPASARVYTVEASQRQAAKKVIRALERRGKR